VSLCRPHYLFYAKALAPIAPFDCARPFALFLKIVSGGTFRLIRATIMLFPLLRSPVPFPRQDIHVRRHHWQGQIVDRAISRFRPRSGLVTTPASASAGWSFSLANSEWKIKTPLHALFVKMIQRFRLWLIIGLKSPALQRQLSVLECANRPNNFQIMI